jgi:hypothetical protein
MSKLNTYVTVHRVEDGTSHTFGPDDSLPGWAVKGITNPDVWDGDAPASADEPDSGGEPPRSGKGSSTEAWQRYAASLGVTVPEDASRDDIVAAVDAHNAA